MTLNTQSLPDVVGLLPNFFECGNISLDFTLSGFATEYDISLTSVNPSTGQSNGVFSYSTTLPAFSGPTFDLKCLADPINCDLLDGVGGQTLKITVIARNESNEDCPEDSAPLIGYFNLSGPPTPATANLLLYSGLIGDPGCNAQQISNACKVGNIALSFDLSNSSGFITFYEINIEEVDCLLGNPVGVLYDGIPTPINNVNTLQNINLNALQINGNLGYFASNPGLVDGRCFRFEATVGNDCGQSTSFSYFFVDPALPRPGNLPNTETSPLNKSIQERLLVFPNPFQATTTLKVMPDFAGGEARIHAADGREVARFAMPAGMPQHLISLDNQPPGLYMLRVIETQSGQISTFSLLHHGQ